MLKEELKRSPPTQHRLGLRVSHTDPQRSDSSSVTGCVARSVGAMSIGSNSNAFPL